MKRATKISCMVIASLILISSIILGAISCSKHINMTNSTRSNENEPDNVNNKYETNEDLLELDSDEYYIEIGTSKDVLFELTVSDSIISDSIELMGDDTVIGALNDQGLNGDKIAGDNIYSSIFTLYSDTPKSIEYYVIVDKYKSNSIDMTYYKQLTDEDFQLTTSIDNSINEIESTYVKNPDGSINETSAKAVYKELINYFDSLKKQGVVIQYTEYSGTFKLKLSNGTTYLYIFDLSEEDVLGNINKENIEVSFSVASLQPYSDELIASAFDNSAKRISNSNFNYETYDNVNNEDIDVEFMKKLNKYNIILINSHGGFDGEESIITIGEKYDTENLKKYSNLLGESGGLWRMKGGHYGVTKTFFDKQYEKDSFDNTLIYIGSCHGADDSVLIDNNKGLVETLLDKGVDCVFAYTNSVYTKYDNNMCETIFNSMLEPKENRLTTASEALKIAKDKHGEKDPTMREWWNVILGDYDFDRKAELILFEKDNNSDYTLLHNMGYVSGQCVDDEDNMCIFATNNVYCVSDDGTRELYCSSNDTMISNINLILPPDKYILEIIPTSSIYETKEITLDVESNHVINLNNIKFNKKETMTSEPVTSAPRNTTTYINREYGWSVELPTEWIKYGSVGEYAGGFNHTILGQVGFHHKEIHESAPLNSDMGLIFDIGALPHDEYETLAQNHPRIGKLAENSEYVFFWTAPTDLRVDESSEDFERLYNEYNILYNTRDSILESFKLLE